MCVRVSERERERERKNTFENMQMCIHGLFYKSIYVYIWDYKHAGTRINLCVLPRVPKCGCAYMCVTVYGNVCEIESVYVCLGMDERLCV